MKQNNTVKWEPVKYNELMIGDVIKWRDNDTFFIGQVVSDEPKLKVTTKIIRKNKVIGSCIKVGRAMVGRSGRCPLIRAVNAKQLADNVRAEERKLAKESGAYAIESKAIRTTTIDKFIPES